MLRRIAGRQLSQFLFAADKANISPAAESPLIQDQNKQSSVEIPVHLR